MDQPLASVPVTPPGQQAAPPPDGANQPGGRKAAPANRPDALKPVRELLRRAATAEEDYIRQNAILAWAALIAKCEKETPGEDAAKVTEFVDAILWRRPEEPALADGAVLRASRDAVRGLPDAARDEAVNELTKHSRARDEASKAARAAWLLLAFPPGPGVRNALGGLFWRFVRRRQQLSNAARPLRTGFIPILAGTCLVSGLWSVLAWGIVRWTVPDPPGSTLYLHGLLCLPVALAVAWAATPRQLLTTLSDRLIDALWPALLSSLVFLPILPVAYWCNWSDDGPFVAKDDIAATNHLLATGLAFIGVALVRWFSPRQDNMPGAASLAVGAVAGCLGALPAFLFGVCNVSLQLGGFSRLFQVPAIAAGSAYWSILPVIASAGIGSAWSNTMRVPVLRRLGAEPDNASHWGGTTAGGCVLALSLMVFAWGAGVVLNWSIIGGASPLGTTASGCKVVKPPPKGFSTVASLAFGQHYPVLVCATGEVAFYSQITPAAATQPDIELDLYDESGTRMTTSHGVKPPALVYQVTDQFRGAVCLQRSRSDSCTIGRPPNETAAYGMMNLLRKGDILAGENPEPSHGSVSFTMAPDLVALIKQGARGSEEQIRAAAHPPAQ